MPHNILKIRKHGKLVVSAVCPVEELYRQGLQAAEFKPTVSRPIEMRFLGYLANRHRREDVLAIPADGRSNANAT